MKRAYMFNMDDFIRVGGTCKYIETTVTHRDYYTCTYRLYLGGEESVADVDVYKNGARMVKYRDDANYELFYTAGERKNEAIIENDFVLLARNFMLGARMVFMVIFFALIPFLALTMLAQGFRLSALIIFLLSVVAGVCLRQMKPMIWSVMNVEHDDLALIERSVTHESI